MHETKRNPKATREATPTCDRIAEKRKQLVGSSKRNRVFSKFGISLAAVLQTRRRGVLEIKACARATDKTEIQPETCFNPHSIKGCSFLGLRHGFMDHPASSQSNRETLWHNLSSEPSLAFSNIFGVELPEAREKGTGTGRVINPTMETLQMAPYKKKPNGLAPTLSFLTKAGFFLFPVSGAPGRLGDKLRTCPWQETGQKYPPFLLSVFLQKENMLPSIFDFIPVKMYALQKWNDFCTIFFIILKDLLSFCGIVAWFTGLRWLLDFLNDTRELIPISFRGTHPNLILMNLYGHSLKEPLQTQFLRIWFILKKHFCHLCRGFEIHRNSYGLVYMLLICHGNNLSITYA
jgi:hypothetical protein